jgi:hypothetical protein
MKKIILTIMLSCSVIFAGVVLYNGYLPHKEDIHLRCHIMEHLDNLAGSPVWIKDDYGNEYKAINYRELKKGDNYLLAPELGRIYRKGDGDAHGVQDSWTVYITHFDQHLDHNMA